MEIQTNDLIGIAQDYATKISTKIEYNGNVIEDKCCNLQRELRNKIYERISKEFNKLIDQEKISCVERAYQMDDLKDKLFKIINDL